jgi:hypothetical protein
MRPQVGDELAHHGQDEVGGVGVVEVEAVVGVEEADEVALPGRQGLQGVLQPAQLRGLAAAAQAVNSRWM